MFVLFCFCNRKSIIQFFCYFRIKSLETCTELLNVYRTKMCKEQEWIKQMNHNVDDFVRRKELKNAKVKNI